MDTTPTQLTVAAVLDQAMALHRAGNLARAERLYLQVLEGNPAEFDARRLLGVLRNQQGRHDEALELIEEALRLRPNSPNVLSNRGNVLRALNRNAEALASYDMALAMRPDHAAAAYNRGNVLRALGHLDEALASYDRALAAQPAHVDALYNRGRVLQDLGRHEQAVASYDRLLAHKPHFAEALHQRGNALRALGRTGEALASYERLLAIAPTHVEALYSRAETLEELGRLPEALASYEQALSCRPRFVEALRRRGIVLLELGRPQEALASIGDMLALMPDDSEALVNRGQALREIGRIEEAVASVEQALALDPTDARALTERAAALQAGGRDEEALADCDRALAARPRYAEAHYRRGVLLERRAHLHEAIASYDEACSARPDHAAAHFRAGRLRLLLGDFTTGWLRYEWRRKLKRAPPRFSEPEWLGEDLLYGRTILVYPEQGMREAIQFVRYVPLLAARGASVILQVPPELEPLLADVEGLTATHSAAAPLPEFDVHTPLASLPLAFATTLDTIPSKPYLRARPDLVEHWARRLPAGRRIGLAWAGGRARENDRSIALDRLAPLIARADDCLVSLQRELREDERNALRGHDRIVHVGDELATFADTAAVVANLDLVVAVDTAVVHLAGAMGKPVWVLLPFVPDWRWMIERSDSPWYPTARLFRQPRAGDWESVIAAVGAELASGEPAAA